MASKPKDTLFKQKIIVLLYEGFDGNATDMAIRLGCTRNTTGKVFREWNRMNKTEQGRAYREAKTILDDCKADIPLDRPKKSATNERRSQFRTPYQLPPGRIFISHY